MAAVSTSAQAQVGAPPPPPPPPPVITPVVIPAPTPFPVPSDVNSDMSAGSAMANLGSNFLERLGQTGELRLRQRAAEKSGRRRRLGSHRRAGFSNVGRALRNLGYQRRPGRFRRRPSSNLGRRCGFGGRVAPGVNVGVSVDQSHTAIDVPLALQSAGLDLTQFGVNASIDKGPWTWAIALVHGFGTASIRCGTPAPASPAPATAPISTEG